MINEDRPVHSPRGASSAYRWNKDACPGSVNLIHKLGWRGNYTSEAAAEGTAAHSWCEELLKSGEDAWMHAGSVKTIEGMEFELDTEMSLGVQEYLDFVREKVNKFKDKGAEHFIEHKLSSILDSDAYGTADDCIYVPGDRIILTDFKYGQGIVVEPTAYQMKYYGYLAYERRPDYMRGDGEPKVIELYICQPRIPHPKGTIRRYVTNGKELEEWFIDFIIPSMELSRDPNAPLNVGDWCIFCPGKKTGSCPALQTEVFEFNVDLEPNHLSDIEVGQVLQKQKAITKFFEAIQEIALKRARQGNIIPGKKLVRQTGRREYKKEMTFLDEDTGKKYLVQFDEAAKSTFGDTAYEDKKFKSPAQMEKLPGGGKFVKTWAYQPDKGTTLADLDDKRDAIIISSQALFGDLDISEDTGH